MSRGKIHFSTRRSGVLRATLCGHSLAPERVTTDETRVGCSDCRKRLPRLSVRDVVPEPAALVEGDVPWQVVPYPGAHQVPVRAMVLPQDMPDRAEWPTWRAAVRAYVVQGDDGWPVRSSSDPGRFEALPGASDGPPQGDAAQRQAARLAIVGWALRRAFAGPVEIMHTPHRELAADICLAVLIASVTGRAKLVHPDSRIGEVRKKSWVTMRSPNEASPETIAAFVAERVGFEVTKRHVGIVVRMGGRAIEPELERRGLIAVRDDGLIERGLDSREENGDVGKVIRTWEKIANYVDLSITTVRRAVAWVPPLPVRYVGKQVEADAEALDAWRKSGPRQPWTAEED